ncbi:MULTISPECIES: lipid A deacylase LpxR family protein [unclassified Thioalkalivibrio]|uniref:lipid A deacylase LpxR family protein n=1 Tax=unclassified Thioalkalivibrio TaxID=2621013 RepID=UPI00037A45BF|nr:MULTISPECIES: lipid A deacylase LpxR family protein [unclassified Thioalkalivibrio]
MRRSYRKPPKTRPGRAALALSGALAVPLGLAAAPAAAERGVDALHFEFENDLFAGEDRYYTNGFRIGWTRSEERVPPWLQRVADALPYFVDREERGRLKSAIHLGQNMYTPEDIERSPADPDDRPYAGWLYLNFSLAEDHGDRLDRLQVTVGTVGPASLADRTQKEVHSWSSAPQPQGWDDQIGNEATLMVGYERQLRGRSHRAEGGWGWDLTPHWGATVGSPFTFANAGAIVRAGRNLPRDYGPPRINPALSGSHTFETVGSMGGYLFAGVDTRLMAYDLFLDGPLFRDGPSVDKHPAVGELTAGFVFHVGGVRLGYTHVWRSREFSGQAKGAAEFGSLHATWQF